MEEPDCVRGDDPEDKYFYLYLLTNPDTTQIGIYNITKKQMAFDFRYSIESVHSLMDSEEETDTYIDIACEDLDETSMCHDAIRGENKK